MQLLINFDSEIVYRIPYDLRSSAYMRFSILKDLFYYSSHSLTEGISYDVCQSISARWQLPFTVYTVYELMPKCNYFGQIEAIQT